MNQLAVTRPAAARLPQRIAPAGARPGAVPGDRDARATLRFVRDPLRIVMFALTVFNVSRLHQAIPLIAKFRPVLLLVAVATAYAFLNPKSLTRFNIFATWPMRRVALLGLLACASAAFGLSLGGSARFILDNYSKTVLCCFLLAMSIRDARDLYTFLWAYAVSCGFLAYFSLFLFHLTRDGPNHAFRLGNLFTYDSNDVCVVILVGLGAVLSLLSVVKGPRRVILYGLLLGIGATFARSGSRGGFLGLLAFGMAAFFLISGISLQRRIAMLVVLALAVGIFAPRGYWEQMSTILAPKADYNYSSINGRKQLVQRGLSYMARYPVFGIGISNFWRAECSISGLSVGHGGTRCGAPHNSYVEAGSELGAPGLIVWGSLVLGGIWSLLRLRGRLPRHWRRGNETERFLYGTAQFFALALVGFAVSSFFVSFAWIDIVYIEAALITGLYVSIKAYRASPATASMPDGPTLAFSRRVPGWRVMRSAARNGLARRFGIRTGAP